MESYGPGVKLLAGFFVGFFLVAGEMRCVRQLPACGHITLMFLSAFADKAAVKLPRC